MSGRYADFESQNTRSSQKSRYGHISPAVFGFYNKNSETSE